MKTGNVTKTVEWEEVLTVDQVAGLLQVEKSWIYRHADELGCVRLGKYLRFIKPDVMSKLRKSGPQPNDKKIAE